MAVPEPDLKKEKVEVQGRLLVIPEGQADGNFIRALCSKYTLDFLVLPPPDNDQDGESQFATKLSGFERDFESIRGVVMVADNENKPAKSFKGYVKHIKKANNNEVWAGSYPVPEQAWAVAEKEDSPPLAILTLPELGRKGSLETLIWDMLEADETHSQYTPSVLDFLDGKPTHIKKLKNHAKYAKAQVSALLAATCVKQPGLVATHMWQKQKGYRELLSSPVFKPVATFLRDFQLAFGDPKKPPGEIG